MGKTTGLTKDQKLGMRIASHSMYGSFGTILPDVQYDHELGGEKMIVFESILSDIKQERLEYKKLRDNFFKEAFLYYNKEKIAEFNSKNNNQIIELNTLD